MASFSLVDMIPSPIVSFGKFLRSPRQYINDMVDDAQPSYREAFFTYQAIGRIEQNNRSHKKLGTFIPELYDLAVEGYLSCQVQEQEFIERKKDPNQGGSQHYRYSPRDLKQEEPEIYEKLYYLEGCYAEEKKAPAELATLPCTDANEVDRCIKEEFYFQVNGCDLRLMSNLPRNGICEKGKMYLERQGNKLHYLVMTPNNERIEADLDLNEDLECGIDLGGLSILTQKILDNKKIEILEITSKRGHVQVNNNGMWHQAHFKTRIDDVLDTGRLTGVGLVKIGKAGQNKVRVVNKRPKFAHQLIHFGMQCLGGLAAFASSASIATGLVPGVGLAGSVVVGFLVFAILSSAKAFDFQDQGEVLTGDVQSLVHKNVVSKKKYPFSFKNASKAVLYGVGIAGIAYLSAVGVFAEIVGLKLLAAESIGVKTVMAGALSALTFVGTAMGLSTVVRFFFGFTMWDHRIGVGDLGALAVRAEPLNLVMDLEKHKVNEIKLKVERRERDAEREGFAAHLTMEENKVKELEPKLEKSEAKVQELGSQLETLTRLLQEKSAECDKVSKENEVLQKRNSVLISNTQVADRQSSLSLTKQEKLDVSSSEGLSAKCEKDERSSNPYIN